MTKFKGISITLAGMALCAAVVWYGERPPKDPTCNGVKLSAWIKESNRDWSNNKIKPEDLRSMGPEAAEFLAYSIRTNVPRETRGLGEQLPGAFRSYLPDSLYKRERSGSHEQCLYALEQLSNLGPQAQPAIPLLVKLLDHSDKSLRDAAARGLNSVGPESWDEVEDILGHIGSEGRRSILFTLTSRLSAPAPDPFKVEVGRILEIYLDACADRDPEIQVLGVGGLLNCQASYSYHFTDLNLPERAGPTIVRCLNQGEGLLKVVSARALYYYPESIGPALHSLERMAEDQDSFYRDPARAALQAYEKARGARN